MQLTATVAEYVARAIEAGRVTATGKRHEALVRRQEKEEREYDAWAWDALNETSSVFGGVPFVAVA